MIDDIQSDANVSSDFESPSAPITAVVAADAATSERRIPSSASRDAFLRDVVHTALDSLDLLGDKIAGAVGLR